MRGHLPELFRQYGRPRQFAAGQQIFLKDSPAKEIYYLERGKVRAYLLYPNGTERTLCFVERGNLVGEEVAARPPVRIVCADAVTDLLMYSMDAETLFRVCREAVDCYPELLRLYMQFADDIAFLMARGESEEQMIEAMVAKLRVYRTAIERVLVAPFGSIVLFDAKELHLISQDIMKRRLRERADALLGS